VLSGHVLQPMAETTTPPQQELAASLFDDKKGTPATELPRSIPVSSPNLMAQILFVGGAHS
jgi:hypothetical protein